MATAAMAGPVTTPSALIDHERLKVLKGRAGALEAEPGGRLFGTLVHEVLAVIPLDRPDLAEAFVQWFAARRGVRGGLVQRAAALVKTALASDPIKTARQGRSWREVPFVVDGLKGTLEGAMDLVVEAAGMLQVVDFKTDAVVPDLESELQAAYTPQLDACVSVLRKLGVPEVRARLLFLNRR